VPRIGVGAGMYAVEPYFNERGERVVWLEVVWVDRLFVAQKLALAHPGYETGLTSAAIIITQIGDDPDGRS
jgi:hypothetical protein